MKKLLTLATAGVFLLTFASRGQVLKYKFSPPKYIYKDWGLLENSLY